jgi:diaminopimelate epimerase
LKFTKMQGCGNDFLVVDGFVALDADRVREICDRRRGVGADGILVIGTAEGRRWPVTLHNADGSLGESCGNGARCVARYLLDRHGGESLDLRFIGGDVSARREGAGIAITLRAPTPPELVRVDGALRAYRVSVGNPHVVVFVADPATVDLSAVAVTVRGLHGDANVELARVLGPGLITMRADERGVGETQACGTGACATVAAAACEHRLEDTVRVHVPGGELLVRHGAGRDTFELAGPAEYSFEGRVG